MLTEIILSGFGGQGILFAGKNLAYGGMDAGKEISWPRNERRHSQLFGMHIGRADRFAAGNGA